MEAFLQSVASSLIRFGMVWLAAKMVDWGVWEKGDAAGYVAAGTLAITALIWSAWKTYGARIKFLTALDSPAGITESEVKAKIASGKGASL